MIYKKLSDEELLSFGFEVKYNPDGKLTEVFLINEDLLKKTARIRFNFRPSVYHLMNEFYHKGLVKGRME